MQEVYRSVRVDGIQSRSGAVRGEERAWVTVRVACECHDGTVEEYTRNYAPDVTDAEVLADFGANRERFEAI